MEFIKNFIKETVFGATKEAIDLKEGLFFQEHEDYDRSIAILAEVIEGNPVHAHAYYLRGRAKWLRGDYLIDEHDTLQDLEKADELGSKSARWIIQEIHEARSTPYQAFVK